MPPRLRPPPLFPYTTLFRSSNSRAGLANLRNGFLPPDFSPQGERSSRGFDFAGATTPVIGATLKVPGEDFTGTTRSALDRKSTRLNSSHLVISYAVFCLKQQ